MRVLVVISAAVATLGLAAFGIFAAQKAAEPGGTILAVLRASSAPAPAASAISSPATQSPVAAPQAPIAATASVPALASPPAGPTAPTRVAQNSPDGATASPTETGSSAPSAIPPCDKPGGMGLARVVEIDTTGGPAFGMEHFKQYDFLQEHEVVLTFDDGPWPVNTPEVIKALTDQCLKATFFEIGEHAMWHPEISKIVAQAGMTIGSHTWSHKDLAKQPYAGD